MAFDALRTVVTRRPGWVAGFWLVLAVAVGLAAPDLTRLAAEGQAKMLGPDAESRRAAELLERCWPDQSQESVAVAMLYRPGGLTAADRDYWKRLGALLDGPGRPGPVLRVLGAGATAEVAARLVSRDGTVALIVLPMSTTFVSPRTHEAVTALRSLAARSGLEPPPGLRLQWTGDAVLGRDYMAGVQTSLDRAAAATVVLLLGVLLVVYRSLWLAMVPLTTIGLCLVTSRGLLAWLNLAGWEVSPLVELFLVAVLFGSGTDFCLFVSWRFAEAWDPADPAAAMDATLRRGAHALLTSGGTVVVGLLLMGTTRFSLFSSTGPAVALGLVLTLAATLTLTPALLVLLARHRPRAFRGLTRPTSGGWERVGRAAMARPLLSWAAALLVMAPLAALGLRTDVVQDVMTELPASTPSSRAFRLLSEKFGQGLAAPLAVVLESEADLRGSEGLALIDDLSRLLARSRRFTEVRSATQPLGSPEPLNPARIASRLGQVEDGFGRIAGGAEALRQGLAAGAARLRAAVWIEDHTGLSLTGAPPPDRAGPATGLRRASAALLGTGITPPWGQSGPASTPGRPAPKPDDPRLKLVDELLRAAEGAGRIAEGAGRARGEVAAVLRDPVGRRALDRLLVDAATVRDHPELLQSFAAYLSPDGRRARIDLAQADRVFSAGAMDGVVALRRQVGAFLDEAGGPKVTASVAGSNAESADIRALTRADQVQSWVVIPVGVFLVLWLALRDAASCLNLVATMLLSYAFALGATRLVFVTGLGAEGVDWKVPYFLFVLLVAVGVDYNVFLMTRLREESAVRGLRRGIVRAVGQTGGLISSAAAITACSFASFLTSPLGSIRQLGFALVVGIAVDALLVRPVLVPCGYWLLCRLRESGQQSPTPRAVPALPHYARVSD